MKLLLYQPNNGYCYNSDTHFLYSFIIKNLEKFKNIKGELLDIGSGSGILGLLVARDNQKLSLNQCEIQKVFQFLTNLNSKNNKIMNKLFEGSFLDVDFDKNFDICISNPPFYHSNVIKSENTVLNIARYRDSLPIDDFFAKVYKVLNQDGKFFFCYDAKQINELLISLTKFRFNIESIQFVHPNLNKDASLVMIYARKNSKSLTKIMPPLIMFDNNGEFREEINDIYKKSATYSIKVDLDEYN